jgi:hypothetical protein
MRLIGALAQLADQRGRFANVQRDEQRHGARLVEELVGVRLEWRFQEAAFRAVRARCSE